jgi:hypothetical protein
MRKSKTVYLGLLGFLGLLGLFTGNYGLYGFFGFFGFFSPLGGRGSDERVERNVNRACRNAFVFDLGVSALFIVYIATSRVIEAFAPAFAIIFAGSLILFTASFIYYDRRGD